MRLSAAAGLIILLGLSGCATRRHALDTCDAGPAQSLIGVVATQELGRELMARTRTRMIRWTPPGMVVTSGYRFGQLTIGYDPDFKITHIGCG